jgi:hypothetical protein
LKPQPISLSPKCGCTSKNLSAHATFSIKGRIVS